MGKPKDHYIEFVAVTRHILQCTATGEKNVLEQAEAAVHGDYVEGLQVHDESKPLLLHEPYGSEEFGPSDGPAWFEGDTFDGGTDWMRDTARRLLAKADAIDARG